MPNDIDNPLILFQDILEHTDTGLVRRPPELIGVKQAAARYDVSERTLRRDCKEHGIALLEGKTYLVVVLAADAFYVNDTGPLHNAQHDIETIRQLTGWPISPSTASGHQVMSAMWNEVSVEETKMRPSFSPTQRFPETLRMRIPEGMGAVLQFAARRRAQSTSDWVRQVLLDRLNQEGLVVMDTGAVRRPEDI